ncbi:MAG: hypothetical protein ACKVOB_07115 [Sphingomonas sp.]
MFSIKLYAIVAVAIALVAFGIGQFAEGFGVPFMALASTLWTAYSVNHQRQHRLRR